MSDKPKVPTPADPFAAVIGWSMDRIRVGAEWLFTTLLVRMPKGAYSLFRNYNSQSTQLLVVGVVASLFITPYIVVDMMGQTGPLNPAQILGIGVLVTVGSAGLIRYFLDTRGKHGP